MTILGFELEEIARLMALMEARGLEELVVEEGDRYLRIRGPRPPKATRPPSLPFTEEMTGAYPTISAPRPRKRRQQALPSSVPDNGYAPSADQIVLASPMVGTFYRAEKPGAPPLIEVGQHIAVGQTIGIIEAMKIFSEVPAEQAGTVIAIPAQDGQLVQAGAPLFILRKD